MLANTQTVQANNPYAIGSCEARIWRLPQVLGVCDTNYRPHINKGLKTQILASMADPLFDCLIRVESQGNEKAINPMDSDGFPKFGLLQFHRPTFNEWCVDKYGFEDDIFNGQIQLACAHKMIEDGQGYRWPTIKKYCK